MNAEERKKISMKLANILRHKAAEEGIYLDSAGFAFLDDILWLKSFHGVTEQQVEEVVATNDKQRFSLQRDRKTGRYLIRANQGHTIASINQEELLTPIVKASDFPVVVHGTTLSAWELIQATGGLKRMGRNHIHFAQGRPGESGVISGMRTSSQCIIYINLAQALADDIPFFVSDNGVVLSPGLGAEGLLPFKYIVKVVRTRPDRVIYSV